jgi:hypothetical protein
LKIKNGRRKKAAKRLQAIDKARVKARVAGGAGEVSSR